MKRVLVTGGTVFVSKYTAAYFVEHGYDVYVLNRNSRPQVPGVTLMEADRHQLDPSVSEYEFDAVIDVTAYNEADIRDLAAHLGHAGTYIMVSSSAVYPETGEQPFREEAALGENRYWGAYGLGKIGAETALLQRIPDAYILRPPYLYGPMNNVYREAFVFDCAMEDRTFCLPRDGRMKLQFFHVRDLCRVCETIIERRPDQHIYNVGNDRLVTIREWVEMCYACAGRTPRFSHVAEDIAQRDYFPFYDYEYCLDVKKQGELLPDLMDMQAGLRECFAWYQEHADEVRKKPLLEYIDTVIRPKDQDGPA